MRVPAAGVVLVLALPGEVGDGPVLMQSAVLVWLMTGADAPDSWRTVAELPLAGPRARVSAVAGMAADIRSADQLIRFVEDGGQPSSASTRTCETSCSPPATGSSWRRPRGTGSGASG